MAVPRVSPDAEAHRAVAAVRGRIHTESRSMIKKDFAVIPAKAGIQGLSTSMDSRFRGNDEQEP
jgi:hypothetical protein